MKKNTFGIGDRVKKIKSNTVWIVERFVERDGLPMHVKLLDEHSSKSMMISKYVVENPKEYQVHHYDE